VNQYFKLVWTEGGHQQFTIIKSLAICAQKQEVNETNVESWRCMHPVKFQFVLSTV